MTTPSDHPGAQGTLRRLCLAWSRRVAADGEPSPQLVAQAEAIDRFIRSRAAIGAWIGVVAGTAGAMLGLHANGASWLASVVLGVLGALAMVAALVAGWLLPERYSAGKLWKIAGLIVIVTFAGRIGRLFSDVRLRETSGLEWVETALALLWDATPFQLVAGLVVVLLAWASSTARRRSLQHELAQARAAQALEAAAGQLSEARLQLLQAQIQPHFLFNTLAALQHWVDVGDGRAAPLLRALTAFLRGSTEMMLKPGVTLGQECEMVRHYLTIMQSRLGERLRWRIEVAADCEAQQLPPGLLITLVENAVEHGVEPQLRGGEVRVAARRAASGAFELRVCDDGAGMAANAPEGVGLTNSRERLRHQFGGRAELRLGPNPAGAGTEVRLDVEPDSGGSQTA